METFLNYFCLSYQRSGFWRIFQSTFARRALLKGNKSLNPKPPIFLLSPNLAQFCHCIFVSRCWLPHQNRDIIEANSLHSLRGKRKTLIEYIGMAWITDLRRISFSALKRYICFQLWTWAHTRSLILLKVENLHDPPKQVVPNIFQSYCTQAHLLLAIFGFEYLVWY